MKNITQLEEASINGDINEIKQLLLDGVNPSISAIEFASIEGYLSIVKILVENIKQKETFNPHMLNEALECASSYGHIDVVEYLIDNGAKTTLSSVQKALKYNNSKIINILIFNTNE